MPDWKSGAVIIFHIQDACLFLQILRFLSIFLLKSIEDFQYPDNGRMCGKLMDSAIPLQIGCCESLLVTK